MDMIERLLRSGLSSKMIDQRIMAEPWSVRRLMRLGLSSKTSRRVLSYNKPYAIKGTTRTRKVADLRSHHVTQNRPWKYSFGDPTSVARKAALVLDAKRSEMVASGTAKFFIPLPGWTGKPQPRELKTPEVYESAPSRLSDEVHPDDMDVVSEEDCQEMEEFYESLCANLTPGAFSDDEFLSELEDDDSIMQEPDDYDIEMAKIDAKEKDEANRGNKRTRGSGISLESPSFDLPGDYEHDDKRQPAAEQWKPNPKKEEPGRQTKRKRESAISLEPTFDLQDDYDHPEKRRKPAEDITSSQVPPAEQRMKGRRKLAGKFRVERGTMVAAVFQAMEAVGAEGMPQPDSSDGPELEPSDLELLEERPSKPEQSPLDLEFFEGGPSDSEQSVLDTELFGEDLSSSEHESSAQELFGEELGSTEQAQPSVDQDLKAMLSGALDPGISQDDVCATKVVANLLLHQDSVNTSELDPMAQEAVDNSDELHAEEEPSQFVAIPRTARISEHCAINRSLQETNRSHFKSYDKPTKPSEKFQSFFMTRRRRDVVKGKGERAWDEEDAVFIRSGKKMAEPGAKLGAEFVAKSLLDGQKSPLKKLVKKSQMSLNARRRRALQRPAVKEDSSKTKRLTAQMAKSGLTKSRGNAWSLFNKPFVAAAKAIWPSGAWSDMK